MVQFFCQKPTRYVRAIYMNVAIGVVCTTIFMTVKRMHISTPPEHSRIDDGLLSGFILCAYTAQ